AEAGGGDDRRHSTYPAGPCRASRSLDGAHGSFLSSRPGDSGRLAGNVWMEGRASIGVAADPGHLVDGSSGELASNPGWRPHHPEVVVGLGDRAVSFEPCRPSPRRDMW